MLSEEQPVFRLNAEALKSREHASIDGPAFMVPDDTSRRKGNGERLSGGELQERFRMSPRLPTIALYSTEDTSLRMKLAEEDEAEIQECFRNTSASRGSLFSLAQVIELFRLRRDR